MQDYLKSQRDTVRTNQTKKSDRVSNFHADNKKYSPRRNGVHGTEYHRLTLDRSQISLISRRDEFYEMLSYLTQQHFVAFDAEWKPISATPGVALIQFATAEKVFLLDVIANDINATEWNRLAADVFNNVEILKLG